MASFKVKGVQGATDILHIESTGTLLLTYDGPLALTLKGEI